MGERIATIILFSIIIVPMVAAAYVVALPMGIAMTIVMVTAALGREA